MVPWMWNHRQGNTVPIIKSFFDTLKQQTPNQKVGVAGFSWGGRYAILLSQYGFNGTVLVDAVFAGHPSLVNVPNDVRRPMCPVSVAVGGKDVVFTTQMAEKTKKLWDKTDDENEVVIYKEAKHGFCVRGNMESKNEREDMEQAIKQVYALGSKRWLMML